MIAPDVEHATEAGCPSAFLVYVDPDTVDGRRLRRVVNVKQTANGWDDAGAPLESMVSDAPPSNWTEAAALVRRFLAVFVQPHMPPQAMHPAVLCTVQSLYDGLDAGVRLAEVAAPVRLSEGRLSHLLSQQLGLGLRPYVLWLRLQRAAEQVGRGASMSAAAIAAGFPDGAHMTRTFRRMFGAAPFDIPGAAGWTLPPGSKGGS